MSTFEQIERREAQKASAETLREGVPSTILGYRDCRKCKHDRCDLDGPFCGHPHAFIVSPFGLGSAEMHKMALCDLKRAQLFEHKEDAAPELPKGPGVISAKPVRTLTPAAERINVAFAEIAIQELGYTDDDTDTYGLSAEGLRHGGDLMVEKVEELYVSKAEHDRRVTELIQAVNRELGNRRSLYGAAKGLRDAQRAYMADRGNDELGRKVAAAAVALDEAIEGVVR